MLIRVRVLKAIVPPWRVPSLTVNVTLLRFKDWIELSTDILLSIPGRRGAKTGRKR